MIKAYGTVVIVADPNPDKAEKKLTDQRLLVETVPSKLTVKQIIPKIYVLLLPSFFINRSCTKPAYRAAAKIMREITT